MGAHSCFFLAVYRVDVFHLYLNLHFHAFESNFIIVILWIIWDMAVTNSEMESVCSFYINTVFWYWKVYVEGELFRRTSSLILRFFIIFFKNRNKQSNIGYSHCLRNMSLWNHSQHGEARTVCLVPLSVRMRNRGKGLWVKFKCSVVGGRNLPNLRMRQGRVFQEKSVGTY